MKNIRQTVILFCITLSSISYAQENKLNKTLIPQPVFEENTDAIELYWKAWELAWNHVKNQEGLFQSPYMDEALWDDTIWIWDTEFMVLFCKYAPEIFPGIESLNNFYEPLLNKVSTSLKIQHPDNPPFYAWVESEYYKFTNDKEHLDELINKKQFLQKSFYWFDSLKPNTKLHFEHAHIAIDKKPLGYKWGNVQSGMDNTPRGRDKSWEILWVDAIAQQALAALHISRLAKETHNKEVAKEFKAKYNELKNIINAYYWDEEDGFYYDILESDNSFVKVKTPASYWVMLAEIPSKKQAERMMQHAVDENVFGGDYPWPTVSRLDKDFNEEYGDYWRGAIWLPTAYMGTKALEKYGYNKVANQNAENLLNVMIKTYNTYSPATIWECYNPTKPEPSQRVYGEKLEVVRPDFCGWSALGPISLLIENVLGFYDINAETKTVKWNKHQKGRHGIKNLRFGDVVTDIIGDKSDIHVKSNSDFVLIVNDRKFKVKKGNTVFNLK